MNAIEIENVSKMYRLGQVGAGALHDDLTRAWAKLRGKEDPFLKVGRINNREQAGQTYVWALKDLNLEVKEGEILGLIGRNGAGKSTLLKLLSRVTTPTTGTIRARGRIASLLEVGTGFHPELTGRENIYLNGAILGMTRREIHRRIEEIVEFSGCAAYIDTPVKRFSSGMLVRLGFAVAAHLECEILIVDEVLAVGDIEFQKKCIGKMENMATSGRTVLVVSHQLATIDHLCSQVAILAHGQIAYRGSARDGISHYLSNVRSQQYEWNAPKNSKAKDIFSVRKMWVSSDGRTPLTQPHPVNKPLQVIIEGDILALDTKLAIGIAIYNQTGQTLFRSFHSDSNSSIQLHRGSNRLTCTIPEYLLNEGVYTMELISEIHQIRWIYAPEKTEASIHFEIMGGLGTAPHWAKSRPGEIAPVLSFTNTYLDPTDNESVAASHLVAHQNFRQTHE